MQILPCLADDLGRYLDLRLRINSVCFQCDLAFTPLVDVFGSLLVHRLTLSDKRAALLVNDLAFPDDLVDKFGCVVVEIGFPAER